MMESLEREPFGGEGAMLGSRTIDFLRLGAIDRLPDLRRAIDLFPAFTFSPIEAGIKRKKTPRTCSGRFIST